MTIGINFSTLCAGNNAGGSLVKTRRAVIIGLGNSILTDDAVGPAVARLVHQRLGDGNVDLREAAVGGIELVELLEGYDKAVIIDAIKTDGGQVGDCYLLDLDGSKPSHHTGMTHELGLLEGLEFGRRIGLKMPGYLRVYAVEVADPFTFSTEMSAEVQAAVPSVAEHILAEEFGVPPC